MHESVAAVAKCTQARRNGRRRNAVNLRFRRCTGNTTLEGFSASADARQVLPPEPVAALSDPGLEEADRLLGYDA